MKKKWIFRGLFLLVFIAAAIFILPRVHDITASSILAHTPHKSILAVLFFLLLYVGKSLSFFFPLAILEAAAGLLFPMQSALLLNALGVAAAMTLPWVLGRRKKESLYALCTKYPRLKKLRELRRGNDFLFVLFVRVSGIFPFDAVSFYLGASGIPPNTYFTAGLLGCLPQMIAVTIFGSALDDPSSGVFLIALAVNIAISAVTIILWRIRRKRTA